MSAQELYSFLSEFGRSRDYILDDVLDAVREYMDETDDYDIESVYADHIVDADTVYYMIKQIVEDYDGQDALIYLYNFIGNVNLATDDLFYYDERDGGLDSINGNTIYQLVEELKEYLEYNTDVLEVGFDE